MRTKKITAVVNTLDEEKNLPYALGSVKGWVDEIVVVDMYSKDRTREIAASFGAQVYLYEPMGYADPARQFAIEKSTGEWVLILDADELVPRRLSEKLMELVELDSCDVVNIPWENYLLGKKIEYTGWGPHQDRHSRFFKKGYLNTNSQIHQFIDISSGARVVAIEPSAGLAIVHFNYLDSQHWFEKMNRYTSIEAKLLDSRGNRYDLHPMRFVFGGMHSFWKRFIRERGYKDGVHGFILSYYMAIYETLTRLKLWELSSGYAREKNEERYKEVANQILAEYDGSPASDIEMR